MSIATEITRLQNAKADIKSAIENKGVTVGDGLIDTYADKITEISVGGESEADIYWSRVKSFNHIFHKATFPDDMDIVIDISNDYITNYYDLGYAFSSISGNLNSIKILATEKKPLSLIYAFQSSKVKTIDLSDCPLIKSMQGAFQYMSGSLIEIIGELDLSYTSGSNDVKNAFGNVSKLEEVRFKPNTIMFSIAFSHSSKLSDESIQSIIDGLSELGGETLSLHGEILDKLTTEQLDQIYEKNWEVN